MTRTPTQVASHAQKYFIRQNNVSKRKRRSSLFDISPDSVPSSNENATGASTKNVLSNNKQSSSQTRKTNNDSASQPSRSEEFPNIGNSGQSVPSKAMKDLTPQVVDSLAPKVSPQAASMPNLQNKNPGAGFLLMNGMHPVMQAALAGVLPQMLRQSNDMTQHPNAQGMGMPIPPQLSTLIPFLSQYPAGVTNPNLPFPLTNFNTFNTSWSNLPMPSGMDKFRDSETLFRPTPTHAAANNRGKPFS